MRRTVFALVVVSLAPALALALPAAAGGLPSPTNLVGGAAPGGAAPAACVRPGIPPCMNDAATFTNADRMTQCQGEVREYVDRSMAYLQCLSTEHQNAGQDLSRNVDRFNCRLSGSRTCG